MQRVPSAQDYVLYVKNKDERWTCWGSYNMREVNNITSSELERIGYVDWISIPSELDRYIRHMVAGYYISQGKKNVASEIMNYITNIIREDK